MISENDMKVIEPTQPIADLSSDHVQTGLPIPKSARVQTFSPDEWESFVEEWATTLNHSYTDVRRFAGAGDKGIDIAGFCSPDGFEGMWDNYQCKRYEHPLRPNEIWVEIGKIIYYSYIQEYSPPRAHYFVASRDIGTSLQALLKKPKELREKFKSNWNAHCRKKITMKKTIELEGDLLDYVDTFDFSIFSSIPHVELIEAHYHTGFHAVRFGGGLQPRPKSDTPPVEPATNESRYIRQLLDAYGDHIHMVLHQIEWVTVFSIAE